MQHNPIQARVSDAAYPLVRARQEWTLVPTLAASRSEETAL
jgi:hypothetical protein